MSETTLQHKQYQFLKNINIKRGSQGKVNSENELILDFINYENTSILRFYFFGVMEFNIKYLDMGLNPMIEIEDYQNNQLENSFKYKVYDAEDDIFSFYCNTFASEEINIENENR